MAIADSLNLLNILPTSRGLLCKVAILYGELEPSDVQALKKIIDNKEIPVRRISETLKKHNIDLPDYTIRRHRNRGQAYGCRCVRES